MRHSTDIRVPVQANISEAEKVVLERRAAAEERSLSYVVRSILADAIKITSPGEEADRG